MKKILILILTINLFLNAQEKQTITINDEKLFMEILFHEMSNYETEKNEKTIVKIKIEKNGNFNYKIIETTRDEEKKKYLNNFLEEKRNKIFPNYKNESKVFNIDFKSEK